MLKRLRWITFGVVLGVAGTVWVRWRFRRRLDRAVAAVLPGGLSGRAVTTLRDMGRRLRSALEAGREERARREAELWHDLEGQPRHAKHARPGGAVHRRPGAGARASGGELHPHR